jgi:anti-sigma B factor antagonist
MDISTTQRDDNVVVVTLRGELDGNSAPAAQAQILPLAAEDDAKIILDMEQVGYMSSAGLRMLLVLYRNIVGQGGTVVLVGLSDELRDTMELTGFLDYFSHHPSLDEGLAAIK